SHPSTVVYNGFMSRSISSRRNKCPESMREWLLDLPGYRIVGNFGIVRGIVVRSGSLIGNLGAALQTIWGGNITLRTDLCERTREEAFELLLQHAAEHGANAVIGMRSDAREVMQGVAEVLAHGTAVHVERICRSQVAYCRALS
ncbi:MAG TPA: YbjQ family protein, partial [Xanthobacteraceae bacterium]